MISEDEVLNPLTSRDGEPWQFIFPANKLTCVPVLDWSKEPSVGLWIENAKEILSLDQ